MNQFAEREYDKNRQTRAGWELYGDHRRRTTELLVRASAGDCARLSVLGAGNCNDLDLPSLRQAFAEVHLVDLDADALAQATMRQGVEHDPAIVRHGGFDVTGMLAAMASWTPETLIGSAELDACVQWPSRSIGEALSGPFDVAASVCLLSQLIDALVRSVGVRHPRFVELMQAVRLGHLRLLTGLTAPGGTCVLITDVVSSASFPPLASVPETQLEAVLARLIGEGNFFHGVNPAVLLSLFRTDPVLASEISAVEPVRPWLWNMGPRVYAVFALKVRKAE